MGIKLMQDNNMIPFHTIPYHFIKEIIYYIPGEYLHYCEQLHITIHTLHIWRNYITQTKMEILLHCNKICIVILTIIEM